MSKDHARVSVSIPVVIKEIVLSDRVRAAALVAEQGYLDSALIAQRPAARSAAMMGVCGQRAALGFNLTKLLRGIAERRKLRLAW